MELKGKRIAVLAEELYQELELWYPVLRMREAGAARAGRVMAVMAASTGGPSSSKS